MKAEKLKPQYGGYRDSKHCIPGFNMCVFDVDGGTSIATAQLLLAKYEYIIYTTKRHTTEKNRFRLIMPMSHILNLSEEHFKQFMESFYDWLPFDSDTQTGQRSRKWLTNENATVIRNHGELLDAQLFVPSTPKNIALKASVRDGANLNRLERWFMDNTVTGDRSNQLMRYAYMLVDSGYSLDIIQNNILALNNKLPDSLPETEILNTIMRTVTKRVFQRDGA